jgi:hypothetical protein
MNSRRRVNSNVMRFSHTQMKLLFIIMFGFACFATPVHAQTKPCPPEVICDPSKFDEYGRILWSDEKARLDNAAISLQRESPEIVIFLVAYAGSRACIGEAQQRNRRAKDHLVTKRGVSPERIVLMDGGYQEESLVEIWILPRDMKPDPNPTVNRKDVVLKNCAKRVPAKRATMRRA